jgi:hypothetical protein
MLHHTTTTEKSTMKVEKSKHGDLYVATHKPHAWACYTATGYSHAAAMISLYRLMLELEK